MENQHILLTNLLMENQTLVIASGVGIALLVILLIFWLRRPRKKNAPLLPAEQDLFTERYFEDETPSPPPKTSSSEKIEKVEKLEKKAKPSSRNYHKTTATRVTKPIEEPQLIIVLRVIAKSQQKFTGADIFAVLEDLGLNYGEMRIFHHYGVGEMKVKKPVFSVANGVEPGIFDLKEREHFVTAGLAIFMQLPGPLGGRVAFELMLNTAQRVADVLEGTLIDEREQLVTSDTIAELRDRIAQFERRPITH